MGQIQIQVGAASAALPTILVSLWQLEVLLGGRQLRSRDGGTTLTQRSLSTHTEHMRLSHVPFIMVRVKAQVTNYEGE